MESSPESDLVPVRFQIEERTLETLRRLAIVDSSPDSTVPPKTLSDGLQTALTSYIEQRQSEPGFQAKVEEKRREIALSVSPLDALRIN